MDEKNKLEKYVLPLEGKTNMRLSRRGCLVGHFETDKDGNSTVRGLQFALNRSVDGTLSVRTPDAFRMFFYDGSQAISYRDGRQSLTFTPPDPEASKGKLYRYPDGSELCLPEKNCKHPEVHLGIPYSNGKRYMVNIKTAERSVTCIASANNTVDHQHA